MNDSPSIDEAAARLHAKGWSTGDVAVDRPSGRSWIVSCSRGIQLYPPKSARKPKFGLLRA